MKTIIGFVLFVLCVSVVSAQSAYRADVVSLTTASTTWDSIGTGGTYSKYIDVINLGSTDSLFICTENDTTLTTKLFLPTGASYRWIDSPARWIRTKASSSTIVRQVVVTVGTPRKGL